jgi:hypothetical protein
VPVFDDVLPRIDLNYIEEKNNSICLLGFDVVDALLVA